MTKTKTRHLAPEERRTRLLVFGRQHFSSHSPEAMTLAQIAAQAGVSRALVYHYFGGRRGFFLAVVQDTVNGLVKTIQEAIHAAIQAETSSESFAQKDVAELNSEARQRVLTTALVAFSTYVRDNADIYRHLIRGGRDADDEVGAETDRVRQLFIKLIQQSLNLGVDIAPDLQLAIHGWIAFVEVAAGHWVVGQSVSQQRFIEICLEALNGIQSLRELQA